jgi:hypothetical protein
MPLHITVLRGHTFCVPQTIRDIFSGWGLSWLTFPQNIKFIALKLS